MSDIVTLDNGYVFVPREHWDSDADFPTTEMDVPVNQLFIHHTVTPATDDPCDDARRVERVLDRRRLDGYSYLVHPSGVVLEFAGTNRGEHTGGHNSTSYAFAFIGNYDVLSPTFMQLVNAGRTINLMRLTGVLPADLHELEVLPHKAVKPTACPGANMMRPLTNGANAIDWIRWFAYTNV